MWRAIHCDFQIFIVPLPALHEPFVGVLRWSDNTMGDKNLFLGFGILDFRIPLSLELVVVELPITLSPV
jgi:hypothetical protein